MGAFMFLRRRTSKSPEKMTTTTASKKRESGAAKPFREGYIPGDKDVIMGRGRSIQNHPGNVSYRETIEHYLPLYSRAKCKLDKSLLVNSVVATIRENGCFVVKKNGSWYEASDLLVRERIGASLRDQLHTKYSSSTKSKKQRRLKAQGKLNDEVEEIMLQQDCAEIVARLKILSCEIDDDDELQSAFNEANTALLGAFKKNYNVNDTGTEPRSSGYEDARMTGDSDALTLTDMENLATSVLRTSMGEDSEDGDMEPIPYEEV